MVGASISTLSSIWFLIAQQGVGTGRRVSGIRVMGIGSEKAERET